MTAIIKNHKLQYTTPILYCQLLFR